MIELFRMVKVELIRHNYAVLVINCNCIDTIGHGFSAHILILKKYLNLSKDTTTN